MSRDIGIDLGTANVLIHLKGRGIVLNEPSVVAVDKQSQEVIAIGQEAYEMIGRAPSSIEVVRPLKGGVIDDFDITEAMLTLFLQKINSKNWFLKPNILICCPSNVSEIERISLVEAAERAGGGQIFIEEEPKVAGIGSGIDAMDPSANMVIDIGGGTSDIAILSSGQVIVSESIRIAGDEFDAAIIQYFKDKYQLLIGERSAELIKMQLATAKPLPKEEMVTHYLKGRDLVTGLPKSINVNSNHIYEALEDQLTIIGRSAKKLLEDVEPEVAADIMEKGIILTGGGALIPNMDSFLTEFLNVSVLKADHPMSCVAMGTGLLLDMIQSGKLQRSNLSTGEKINRYFRILKRRLIG
ncbi:rod shape-determining protein [Vaginisenegalia massiliensis]|uniref:rod shape-determining protein n=1 Tax=Vaginisenegalia massiliensis TaxID=2058294 RepID=UPI000F523E53|nr:rod shape-determining protein [Vaginisenegalia massiliensis]